MEIGALHAKRPGGAGDVPFGFVERSQNMFALSGFLGFAQIACLDETRLLAREGSIDPAIASWAPASVTLRLALALH